VADEAVYEIYEDEEGEEYARHDRQPILDYNTEAGFEILDYTYRFSADLYFGYDVFAIRFCLIFVRSRFLRFGRNDKAAC